MKISDLKLHLEIKTGSKIHEKKFMRKIKNFEQKDVDKLVNFIYMYIEQIEFGKDEG